MTITDLLLILLALALFITFITIIVISLTTGFVKTGRMSGGLYCITAPPGNGKSYIATAIAIYFMLLGRKVFTNYPIVYSNGRITLKSRVLTKEMLLKKNFNGSVLIVDEAHKWFWSRDFKSFTDEYKNWFSTLSQHEISLYYIIQHEDRVETIINDCANLFGVVEKTEIPFLEMPLFFVVTWWNRELDMQLARSNRDIEPFHQERFWFDKDIAQSYDTKFFGTDKRPIYEGIDWVSWLKEKYDFDYKGNYDYSLKSQIMLKWYNSIYKPLTERLQPYKTKITQNLSNTLTKIQTMSKTRWSGMGSTFDRDENHKDMVIEPRGGVPSGARRESQLPDDDTVNQIDESLFEEKSKGEK